MIAHTSVIKQGANDFPGIIKFHWAEVAGINLTMIGLLRMYSSFKLGRIVVSAFNGSVISESCDERLYE
jgi:hypothetical protein